MRNQSGRLFYLKNCIENLSREMEFLHFSKADIENSKAEKIRLYVIKNTLLFLKKNNQLKTADELQEAQNLTVGDSLLYKNKSRPVRIPALVIVMLVLCAFMVFSTAGSWIEINGEPLHIWDIAENYTNASAVGGILPGLLMLGECLKCGIIVLYIVLFIRLCFRKKTELPYAYMLIVVVTFALFWISVLLITNEISEIPGGRWLATVSLTKEAWISLILSCGISIIYYKRYEISGVFSGSYKNWEIITKDYPVTNYYPWKDLRFLSAILTQDGNITMEVSYLFLGETRNIHDGEKITAETDIVIKAGGTVYIASRCILELNCGKDVGITKKLVIEGDNFDIHEVEDVKIIIKYIYMENNGDAALPEPRVYAESGLNSLELLRYRNKMGFILAVRETGKVENGWVCRCGLYHKDAERQCEKCCDLCPDENRK